MYGYMYVYSLQQVDFENKKNPYGLTWRNSIAPKYDLYSDSMQSSSQIQFNIVLCILNADLENKITGGVLLTNAHFEKNP